MDTLNALATLHDDDKLIGMWLATKQSENTRRAYAYIVHQFQAHTSKELRAVGLADLLDFLATVEGGNAFKALATNALKSLFSFGSDLRYFDVNVGKPLKAPKQRSELAQRILTETEVIRLVDRTTNKRDHALLRLMYHAGLRVSEVVTLKWAHVQVTSDGAILDVFGKGSKQRFVPISQGMLDELHTLDGQVGKDRYVFQSRKSHAGTLPMDTRQVERLVLDAAKRAGITGNVSPHWLRHSNASHALDNGATVAVVKESLGHESLVTTSRYLHIKPGTGTRQFLKI